MTGNADEGRLVSVLEASSEIEALTIQSFLQSQGIEAAVRSRQIPMYNGIAKVLNPIWGYVLVMESEQETAENLIMEYLDSFDSESKHDEDAWDRKED